MPHERTLLSAAPPTPETWLEALRVVAPAGRVEVLPGAAAQLLDDDGALLATVLLPRRVAAPGEARRLLGPDAEDRPWWSEVIAPGPDPRLGAILEHAARRCDGVIA